jgi:hypothetical protein
VGDKLLSAFSINLGLEESTVRNSLGGENMEIELKINNTRHALNQRWRWECCLIQTCLR